MKILVIYDNTVQPNEIIKEVIGEKGFGDVVVKRKLLKDFYRESIIDISEHIVWMECCNLYDIEMFMQRAEDFDKSEDVKVLHCFADFIVSDKREMLLTYKKISYIEEDIQLSLQKRCPALMFRMLSAYMEFLKRALKKQSTRGVLHELGLPELSVKGLNYIGEISNFIQCITGNFDSRYFNSIQGTEYKIRKSSTNKKKIKSEYQYYHLLPEYMQRWFVMPFDYQEDEKTASYEMERLHMTDIAIKWVHGSIKIEEFKDLLDMYFYFFCERSKKEVSKLEYKRINQALYIDKVRERINNLKKLPEFEKIANLLMNNDKLKSIDDIYEKYFLLKEKVEKRMSYPLLSVIGHGDPCFANAMYNRSTRTLKFIDPKGALCEADLWTNPYYDIAKLSHSICGCYDFFNNAMFDIVIDDKFDYLLTIPFDNTENKEIFKEKVRENGFDYWSVRLYEASLFLSMLPLHIDFPHRVFGFILNAVSILEEIEKNI